MVANELPFGERTAQRLMVIAQDKRLRKATHVSLLPSSWGTLHAISQLTDAELEAAIANGIIHPEAQRKDIEAIGAAHSEPDTPNAPIITVEIDRPRSEPRTIVPYYVDPPKPVRSRTIVPVYVENNPAPPHEIVSESDVATRRLLDAFAELQHTDTETLQKAVSFLRSTRPAEFLETVEAVRKLMVELESVSRIH